MCWADIQIQYTCDKPKRTMTRQLNHFLRANSSVKIPLKYRNLAFFSPMNGHPAEKISLVYEKY